MFEVLLRVDLHRDITHPTTCEVSGLLASDNTRVLLCKHRGNSWRVLSLNLPPVILPLHVSLCWFFFFFYFLRHLRLKKIPFKA